MLAVLAVLAVLGGVVAACAAVAGAIVVGGDVRDDPDLAVRLRPGTSVTAFTDRALRDPHVDAVSSTEPPDDVVLELVDGLTPITRDRLAARLRREPAVMSARVVD